MRDVKSLDAARIIPHGDGVRLPVAVRYWCSVRATVFHAAEILCAACRAGLQGASLWSRQGLHNFLLHQRILQKGVLTLCIVLSHIRKRLC